MRSALGGGEALPAGSTAERMHQGRGRFRSGKKLWSRRARGARIGSIRSTVAETARRYMVDARSYDYAFRARSCWARCARRWRRSLRWQAHIVNAFDVKEPKTKQFRTRSSVEGGVDVLIVEARMRESQSGTERAQYQGLNSFRAMKCILIIC